MSRPTRRTGSTSPARECGGRRRYLGSAGEPLGDEAASGETGDRRPAPPHTPHARASGAVLHGRSALVPGAMRTAEHAPALLEAVTDDPNAAIGAGRRHGLDRALEAVEGSCAAFPGDLECLVVVVPALGADRHAGNSPC